MSVKDKADAIDRFVRTLKSGGLYDDINAACIMAGWTNLAGALYPLKGAAPTNNGFVAADLDAGIGLKGDGSSKYLNSNRADNADPAGDKHYSCYAATTPSLATIALSVSGLPSQMYYASGNAEFYLRSGNGSKVAVPGGSVAGFHGMRRADASNVSAVCPAGTGTVASPEAAAVSIPAFVFARNNNSVVDFYSSATLSWYSIGSSTDLAALDSAVSTLMADLRAIDEDGFDRDALAYIRAVEAADGAFLESGVKKALNRFIVGLKKDSSGVPGRSLWDAIKASCILCGARTIAGALVPLAGTAPTALGGWVSGDYNRETGLVGNGSTKYLDSNYSYAQNQDNEHLAIYRTGTGAGNWIGGGKWANNTAAYSRISFVSATPYHASQNGQAQTGYTDSTGFFAINRSNSTQFQMRSASTTATKSGASLPVAGISANYGVYCAIYEDNGVSGITPQRLAFYSIGTAISDLSLLDSRVTTLVSQIAAAIP